MRRKELVAYAVAFVGPLAGNAVLALLGTFQREWGISPSTVLLSIPAFMFPFAFMQLFSGTISDAYDRRNTIVYGLSLYSIGGFLAALSPSFGFFMGTRLLQGIGYAFVQPVLLALLSEISGKERLGLVMGYYGSSTTAGVALGPLLAGLLAELNWRWTFVLIGLLGITVLLAMLALYSRSGQQEAGVKPGAIRRQLASTLRRRDVVLLSSSGFAAFVSFVGVVSFVSEELGSGHLQLGPSEIGIALSVNGFSGMAFSPFSGRLVDTRGARISTSIGFVLAALSTLLLAFEHDRYWLFIVALAIQGAGTSYVWAALLTMSVRAHPELRGTASSVFNSSRFFGYAMAPVILSPVFVISGFAWVMAICASLCAVALVLVLSSARTLDRG